MPLLHRAVLAAIQILDATDGLDVLNRKLLVQPLRILLDHAEVLGVNCKATTSDRTKQTIYKLQKGEITTVMT